jgi:galactokinase
VSAADTFDEAFGRAPVGVWSAPGRVNLIGEHTDYNGGFVLPFAIDMRTTVAASRRDDGRLQLRSLQKPSDVIDVAVDDVRPGTDLGWAGYAAGVVWALRQAGHDVGGLNVVIDGQVPTGAGLSSSAALECSVGLAALDLYEISLPREDLARIAQRAENDFVGVPCGLMDQMASSVCQADNALFFDIRDDRREQVPFSPADLGLAIMVVDTRAHHALADGAYADRRRSCEAAAKILGVDYLRDIERAGLDDAMAKLDDETLRRRVRHVITEDDRVLRVVELLRIGKLDEIGPLMSASHVSLRDDFEVSAVELDTTVDAAVAAGALGARMTGGGFGGSAIALVEAGAVDEVTTAVKDAFATKGFRAPQVFVPKTSDGVRREA